MHELTITQNMLDVVLEQARQAGAKEMRRIDLVVGGMTGVIEECVKFYFNFLKQETIAEGLSLPLLRCRRGHGVTVAASTLRSTNLLGFCPHYGDNNLEVTSGKELFIENIEVE